MPETLWILTVTSSKAQPQFLDNQTQYLLGKKMFQNYVTLQIQKQKRWHLFAITLNKICPVLRSCCCSCCCCFYKEQLDISKKYTTALRNSRHSWSTYPSLNPMCLHSPKMFHCRNQRNNRLQSLIHLL